MKRRTLVSLAVFIALAGGVAYVSTRKPERGISRVSLAATDTAAIDRIELSGKTRLDLHKDGDHWRTEKNKLAATDAVKQLLDAIPRIESSDLLTRAPERYAEFDLDEAKGTHVVAKAGPRVVAEFVVGKAASGGCAIRVGDGVYQVKVTPWVFSRDAAAWLDRRLFEDKVDAATRVEVRLHGQRPFALVKGAPAAGAPGAGDWSFEDPSVVPAGFRYDKGAAQSLVSQIVSAQAKEVLDTDPGAATTKLDDNADVLVYSVKDASGLEVKRELRLGAAQADGSVYARSSARDDVMTVNEALAKALKKAPTDLRDLTLMKLELAKVEALTIVADKMKLSFDKTGGSWKIASSSEAVPKDFAFDPSAVDRRLQAMSNARAIKVAEAKSADAGLASPSAQITARLSGKGTAILAFGKDTKDGNQELVFAKGNADADTYLVTKWIKTSLTGGLQTFKKQPVPPGGSPNFDARSLANLPPEVRAQLLQQLARRPPPQMPPVQATAPAKK